MQYILKKPKQQLDKVNRRGAVLEERAFYIFVAADADKALLAKPSAYQVAQYRLARGEWGIGFHTRNRVALRQDDKVLIYLSGPRELGQHFIASATLASQAKPVPQVLRHTIDAPNNTGSTPSAYVVILKEIQFLPKPVHIRGLKSKFSFVHNPKSKKWGACLQGGTLRISESDFNLVLSASEGLM